MDTIENRSLYSPSERFLDFIMSAACLIIGSILAYIMFGSQEEQKKGWVY